MQQFRYKRKQNQKKTNTLILVIHRIAEKYGFESAPIISCFKNKHISSADFSLNRFHNRAEFTMEFCKKQNVIAIAVGKLIKLWDALNCEYNLLFNGPIYQIPINNEIHNEKSLVFISKNSTEAIVQNELIQEPFTTSKRLYQYLNWTIRINNISQLIHCFSTPNGINVMIINSELHNKYNQTLYILCIKNDIISIKAQKWQFVKLVTAKQIIELVTAKTDLLIAGFINQCSVGSACYFSSVTPNIPMLINQYYTITVDLPIGARNGSVQFGKFRQHTLLSKQDIYNGHIKKSRYAQLKSVQTSHYKNKNQNVLKVSLDEFHHAVRAALRSRDIKHEFIAILSILTGKYSNRCYSVDQVLPVQINSNWIGIMYRNDIPLGTLIDVYDIINKAILCDPNFDPSKLDFFTNNITKIEIVFASSSFNAILDNNKYDTMLQTPVYKSDKSVYEGTMATNNTNDNIVLPAVYEGNNTTINNGVTTNTISHITMNNDVKGNYQFQTNNVTHINADMPTMQNVSSITEGKEMTQMTLPNVTANTWNIMNTLPMYATANIVNNTQLPMSIPIITAPIIPIPNYYIKTVNSGYISINGVAYDLCLVSQPILPVLPISNNYMQSQFNQNNNA